MNKSNTTPSLVLQANDIICGRGSSQFTGNIAYRRFVDSLQECYENAPSGEGKRAMSKEIVDRIRKKTKGRFLSRDIWTGKLTELDNEKCAKKVVQRFRRNNLAKALTSGRTTPVTPLLAPQANDVLRDTNSRNGMFFQYAEGNVAPISITVA
jgi:hypothetical protein